MEIGCFTMPSQLANYRGRSLKIIFLRMPLLLTWHCWDAKHVRSGYVADGFSRILIVFNRFALISICSADSCGELF